jgi:hypothetical protein
MHGWVACTPKKFINGCCKHLRLTADDLIPTESKTGEVGFTPVIKYNSFDYTPDA